MSLLSPSVGEEIEMTPMVFAKGLADSGCWGDKLFGRLVSEELRGGGHGCGLQKASQAKVIYGLEPIFESGRTCVIKVSSLLVFGPSSETSLHTLPWRKIWASPCSLTVPGNGAVLGPQQHLAARRPCRSARPSSTGCISGRTAASSSQIWQVRGWRMHGGMGWTHAEKAELSSGLLAHKALILLLTMAVKLRCGRDRCACSPYLRQGLV